MPKLKFSKFFSFSSLCLFSLSFFITISPVFAQVEDKLLWLDTECKAECDKIKKETTDKLKASEGDPTDIAERIKMVEGFNCIDNEGVKDDNLCYCLAPPMATTLQVPIGETKVVYGLVDYIILIFNWGVKAVAAIAVVMIMIAGIQWLTAAGSSTLISQAQERIKNAIIGLVLILGSVFILNMINPALTSLKGLEIKMVPTIAKGTYWCRGLDIRERQVLKLTPIETTGTGGGGKQGAGSIEIGGVEAGKLGTIGDCGTKYQIDDNEDSICYGDECEPDNFCIQKTSEKFSCERCNVFGKISGGRKAGRVKLLALKINKYQNKIVKGISWDFSGFSKVKEVDVSGGSQYCIYSEDLKNDENTIGYLLEIRFDQWAGRDDWYLIDRDGGPIIVNGKAVNTGSWARAGKPGDLVDVRYFENRTNLLLQYNEFVGSFKMPDIEASNANFPPR